MNINGYGRYKVTVNKKFDYISGYDYDDKTYECSKGKDYYRRTMNGGELIDFIAKYLNHPDCMEVRSNSEHIYISLFNPMDGTGSDIVITYKETKSCKTFGKDISMR